MDEEEVIWSPSSILENIASTLEKMKMVLRSTHLRIFLYHVHMEPWNLRLGRDKKENEERVDGNYNNVSRSVIRIRINFGNEELEGTLYTYRKMFSTATCSERLQHEIYRVPWVRFDD